ncbi:MAG: hypothetical protein WBX25_01845 [Rhodomicrobium sp.]
MNPVEIAALDALDLLVVVDNESDTLSSVDRGVPQLPELGRLVARVRHLAVTILPSMRSKSRCPGARPTARDSGNGMTAPFLLPSILLPSGSLYLHQAKNEVVRTDAKSAYVIAFADSAGMSFRLPSKVSFGLV